MNAQRTKQSTVHCTLYTVHFILILILIYGLLNTDYRLVYGEDDYLDVKGNTRVDTVTFAGNLTAYPVAPLEGEVFYHSQAKLPRYFDGATWKCFGGPKTVATKIVSAYNSSGATRDGTNACVGDGTTCNNPKADYTCDGADDQHEINQAMNSLPANGGAVYLLEGTYNISSNVSSGETLKGIVPHSNTALVGTGRGTVLRVTSGASSLNVINAAGTQAAPLTGILISQLMIDGNSKTGSANWGIGFTTVTNSKIDKVWVENMSSSGIYLNSSSNNTISGSNIQSNGFYGIGFLSNSNNNIISGNNIQGNTQHGIYLDSSSNNTISNNNIQSNRDPAGASVAGICLYNPSNNNIISGNNIQLNSTHGIYVMQGYYNIISNNNIQSNSQFGICLADGDSSTVSGNNIQGNTQHGIFTNGAGDSIITANVIYDNGSNGAFDGINLNDNNVIISSNRIYDSLGTGYGIKIAGSNNYLIGNLIDGTTGTSATGYYNPLATPPYDHRIQDLGTSTKYTDKAKVTLERSTSISSTLDAATYPKSYVAFPLTAASITLVLSNGKSAGDLLILENISTTVPAKTVTIKQDGSSGLVNLEGSGDIILGPYDTLKLIWNGSRWLEIGYVNNL